MKKIILSIIICITLMSIKNVSAIEKEINNYTNNNGVLISKENYEKIKDIMTQNQIDELDESIYSLIDQSEKIISYKDTFIETTTFNDNMQLSFNRELSAEEYQEISTKELSSYVVSDNHYTTYKHISLIVRYDSGKYIFNLTNQWLLEPATESYDVLGLRWSGSVTKNNSDAKGNQEYYNPTGTIDENIPYSYTSTNFKFFSNGLGLSQNLKDGPYKYNNSIEIYVTCTGIVNLYGTYQHAQSDVTLAQSKSYSLSSSGLGGVLYYSDSSIRNKYDNTGGLSVSFTC